MHDDKKHAAKWPALSRLQWWGQISGGICLHRWISYPLLTENNRIGYKSGIEGATAEPVDPILENVNLYENFFRQKYLVIDYSMLLFGRLDPRWENLGTTTVVKAWWHNLLRLYEKKLYWINSLTLKISLNACLSLTLLKNQSNYTPIAYAGYIFIKVAGFSPW